MDIPNCYDAIRQAEQRALLYDRAEGQREKCGSCGRIIELGERYYRAALRGEQYALCRGCKDLLDESEEIMEGCLYEL